jgi:hypothetical protein
MACELSYRVKETSGGWLWELLGSHCRVLAQGVAETSIKARARAMEAAISLSLIEGQRHIEEDASGVIHHFDETVAH